MRGSWSIMRRRAAALALAVLWASSSQAAETIIPAVSAAAEGSHVVCDATGTAPNHKAPCSLRSAYVTTGAAGGYLLIFNAIAAPADGAVLPRECVVAPANQTTSLIFNDETMESYNTGLTAVFSTTGCFTKTVSATAFFKVRVQ